MKKNILILLLCSIVFSTFSKEICEDGDGVKTPYGRLITSSCSTKTPYSHRDWISLDKVKILESEMLFDYAFNKTRSIWIYGASNLSDFQIGCSQGLYLIDLSFTPPKVIQFGVKNACNEFDWASWGDKGSVIALKKDVRFTYKDGKIIPPKDMEHMWSSMVIPVPRGKTSADQPYPNYIIPYAKEISLPQK